MLDCAKEQLMNKKSGGASGSWHGGCGAKNFAGSASHWRTYEVAALRPERPCHVQANGWPFLVVFVTLHVPCSALALSCKQSHSVRCMSPNLTLA